MPTGKGFLIELANPERSFFPGQTIIGRVGVLNDKPKDLKNISITFEGNARVHWTTTVSVYTGTGQNRKKTTQTKHFTANESYFTCKIMLFGNESGTISLPPGTTYYPFQFTLPGNLPSSFTSKLGTVHYVMEARMKRSWHKSDLTAIIPFTVNGILDLNIEPGTMEPFENHMHKNICCCCCKSGPVGYKLKLPRRGFVPGEFANFSIAMLNMSRRKVNKMEVTLVQICTFHAQGAHRQIKTSICKVVSPSVDPGGAESWGRNVLKIPPIPPTRLANCRIIDVQYYLQFEMNLSGPSMDLRSQVPIVIGTIPLRNTFVDLIFPAPVNPVNQMSGGGLEFVTPIPGPSAMQMPAFNPPVPTAPIYERYPDLPPPTYAEAMEIDMDSFSIVNEQKGTKTDWGMDSKGKVNMNYQPDSTGIETESGGIPGPSAPPDQGAGYLPYYITYGFNNNP